MIFVQITCKWIKTNKASTKTLTGTANLVVAIHLMVDVNPFTVPVHGPH